MLLRHSIRAAALALAAGIGPRAGLLTGTPQRPTAGTVPSSNFTIFIRAVRAGSEQISLERTAEGWTISSSGEMGAPIELVAKQVEVRYTADWKPLGLKVDGTLRRQPLIVQTEVAGETAHSRITQAGQSGERTDAIAANAVFLPSPFFGPFEALSQLLKSAEAGSTIPAYMLQTSIGIQVGASSDETIQTASH